MVDQKSLSAAGQGWRRVYKEHRFGILLVLIAVLMVGSQILFGFGLSVVLFDALTAMVVLAAILSLCFERRQRMYALLFGVPTLAICLGGHALSETASRTVLPVGHLCGVFFFFGSAVLIVKSLFNARSLTYDSIFGAVCGYLFLGLGWATAYSMIETLQPGSFQISQSLSAVGQTARPQLLTYYSFVTLTTVGYGDVTPISPITCTFAWIEAMAGQFYLAIIVAALVSVLVMKSSQPQSSDPAGELPDSE